MDPAHTIHDNELLLSMRQGNKGAFNILFKKYYAMLCAYGNRFVSLEEAEEIVQDVMLRVWENRDIIVIESSLSRYLLKSVHNMAINLINKNQVKQRADTFFYREMLNILRDTDYYHFEELTKHIQNAIDQLPSSYREAFVMHRFRGMTYKSIADSLHVSSKTIDYRIQQALKLLREELKEYLPTNQ